MPTATPEQRTIADLARRPVTELKGVGDKLAAQLARVEIRSVQDLLFHLPLRYQDRTRITPIAALQPGVDAVIQGRVAGSSVVMGRRRSLLVRLEDHSGLTSLRFFHFSAAQQRQFTPGHQLLCFGEPRLGSTGLEFYHPEYRAVKAGQPLPLEDTLTPIYPSTEGLSQQRLRALCGQALDYLKIPGTLQDWLTEHLRQRHQLMPLIDAVRALHQPSAESAGQTERARYRLAFEELLAHHLSLLQLRARLQAEPGNPLPPQQTLTRQLRTRLGFQLTGAQERVVAEISADLQQHRPMLRLVQGDVGSGKTVVAALAALQAIENSQQACIMAPTEILAEQHYRTLKAWCQPLGITVAWLTGRLKGQKRAAQLDLIASGDAALVVGTHALFQDSVQFQRLGLVIIDEQHRFGVHQRLALRQKGEQQGYQPHQLIMTATPIPRTLAMSAYADLDCSVIDELPPGRKPVTTVALSDERRPDVIRRIRDYCRMGHQAYWVCTLIEESEALQCQAAEVTAAQLQQALPDLSIGLVHGRMKATEKADVMDAFKSGALHLLVATTVIEVGVDVPNASLMVIENPERLGLAQLHQLRGRVGRGSTESHCVLMYHPPLSAQSRERLGVMRASNDGFVIAEKDLQLRGPGEVLGTRQTGLMQLKVADLERDQVLLDAVKNAARDLLQRHPEHAAPLIARWLGQRQQLAGV